MTESIRLEINDIPHGHGMSFKRGVADALLDTMTVDQCHPTHRRTHERGLELGKQLKQAIAIKVQ